jgi:prolipoprotein diacylglyceryl transferase
VYERAAALRRDIGRRTAAPPTSFNQVYVSVLAQLHWDLDPELVGLGPLPIRWYSLGWLLAFAVGLALVRRAYRRQGRLDADLDTLLMYVLLGAMIGARLGHCAFYRPGYYLTHPIEIVAVWKGLRGLASHGGAIGILVALAIYSRRRPDQPWLWLLDRLAGPTALGGAFIRVGNFANSEILGRPTGVPWAIVFTRVDDVPRHPAQLYEAVAYLGIALLLLRLDGRRGGSLRRGFLIGVFLCTVFGARFLIEFVKERNAPWAAGLPLSVGQMLSIPLVVMGVAFLAVPRLRERAGLAARRTR